jgi:hypothetical protein
VILTGVRVIDAPEVEIQSCRIGQTQRVIPNVGVAVQSLRVLGMTAQRIGTHEASHAGGVVPGPEVVQPAFGVAFFAGEFVVQGRVLASAVVHIGYRVVGLGDGQCFRRASSSLPWLCFLSRSSSVFHFASGFCWRMEL